MSDFKNHIREERQKAKLTQKQLADLFNQYLAANKIDDVKPVTYAAISRWETGENNPQNETWNALANFFNVEPGYLRGYSTTRQSSIREMFAYIQSEKLSDDPDKDLAIKNVFEAIYEDLSDRIDSLERQVAELENPGSQPQDRDDY
jgi:transcriptional regulator with XRE-family HTH domain